MYRLPLKITTPSECAAAGNGVAVVQPVTAPVTPSVPTYPVATGLPLAVLSPPSTYRQEAPVTGELAGVAIAAAAKARGAGKPVVLLQTPTVPVSLAVA